MAFTPPSPTPRTPNEPQAVDVEFVRSSFLGGFLSSLSGEGIPTVGEAQSVEHVDKVDVFREEEGERPRIH